MLLAFCPRCGSWNHHRWSSLGGLVRCRSCGRSYRLSCGPSCRGCFTCLSVCAALVVGVFACAGLSSLIHPEPKTAPSDDTAGRANTREPAATVEQTARAAPAEPPRQKIRPEPQPENRPAVDEEALRKRQAEYQAARDRYEVEAVEWHARQILKLARQVSADAAEAKATRRLAEAERLEDRALSRYQDIISRYPRTVAAADAKELLDGRQPPEHPDVPKPVPPVLEDYFPRGEGETAVVAQQLDADGLLRPRGDQWQVPPSAVFRAPPASHSKPVYVRGYTRSNGTYVPAYFRAAPGFGGRGR